MLVTSALMLVLAASPAADAPLAQTPPVETESPASIQRRRAVIVGGTGLVLIGAGATFWIVGELERPEATASQEERDDAQHHRVGGVALAALGACVLGIFAVLWHEARPQSGLTALVAPTPGGGAVLASGALP